MISIDEKLNLFRQILIETLTKEIESRTRDFNQEKEALLKVKGKEIKALATAFLDMKIKEAQAEETQIISRASMQKNKILLEARKDLIELAIEALDEKIMAFIGTDAYVAFLKGLVSDHLSGLSHVGGWRIALVHPKDQETVHDLLRDLGHEGPLTYETLPKSAIGGFVITDEAKTLKLDLTLKTWVERHRDVIGGKIYDVLDEAGANR